MKYKVCTTGLAKESVYEATDPDEALYLAGQHEKALRMRKNYPNMEFYRIQQIIKDEFEIPNFKITSCVRIDEAPPSLG